MYHKISHTTSRGVVFQFRPTIQSSSRAEHKIMGLIALLTLAGCVYGFLSVSW